MDKNNSAAGTPMQESVSLVPQGRGPNTYHQVYFRISSSYNYKTGWRTCDDNASFRQETRRIFSNAGWTLEVDDRECVCDTVRKDCQELYLHPMNFSGVVSDTEIPQIEAILAGAETFRHRDTDLYEEYFDLNDEEYWSRLESQRQEIETAILERYRTKRSNLYIAEGQAQAIAVKFTVNRLCDKLGYHNKANLYVGQLIEEMIADGRLVTAKTRHGLGVRTATKRDVRPAPPAV